MWRVVSISSGNVVVTGAAGFIGSHVVERLILAGARVLGVDNFDPFYPERDKRENLVRASCSSAFSLRTVDCTDLDALDAAIPRAPIDAIIHLAAKAGVRPSLEDPVGYMRSNVVGTQAVLELARRREVGRIVFASSSSVYGDADRVPFDEEMPASAPISPYAATKRAGELLCATHAHLYGAGIAALRFFTVYGPRQRPDLAIRKFANLIRNRRPIPFHGDGTTARDYTWIDDIVDGVMSALALTSQLEGRCEVINLGGNRMTTLRRLVELIEDALGMDAIIDAQDRQAGDVSRTCASTRKAERLLGYAPKVPIEDGIPRFVDWMLDHSGPRVTLAGPRVELMAGRID
jgi:UDP-glucuronate 4-epimerase